MFERVTLGIDPGTAATGFAVLGSRASSPARILAAGTIRTQAGADESSRLAVLHASLSGLIGEHSPGSVALERLLWGRNVGSAMSVARASGVALLAAAQAGLPVSEYAPREVKLAVSGDGSAPKEAVRRALSRLHGMEGVPNEPDAADAVAVALCHLHRARYQARAGA